MKIMRWITRALVLALGVFFVYICYQPDVASLRTENPESTALMRLRLEQAKKANVKYPTEMVWKDLDQISPHLVHAILVAEDDTFYEHHGFDFNEIREAIKINWKKKRWAYGGSTITQQLARTLFLSPRKNLIRKAKEALITLNIERTLPKKRILELYLNVVEWGRGIYGAEAASRFYFEKPAFDLTPDEAAALASILPSPRRWSPKGEQAFMARRRTKLLDRMRRAGYIPPEEITPSFESFESPPPTLETPEPNLDELQGSIHESPPALSE